MKTMIKPLLTASALVLCAAAVHAKPVLLKTPIAFGSNLPALGTPITWVSEQLPLVSGGQIKIAEIKSDMVVLFSCRAI